jgi:hypothetical protein
MRDQGGDKNWLDLCQAAATERDPNKLMMLVAEIIKTLDHRNSRVGPPAENKKDCGGRSFPTLYAVGQPKEQICESDLSL